MHSEAIITDLNGLLSGSMANISHGKFVLISRSDRAWIVLGVTKHYPFHAMLVAAFCERESLPFHWERRPDLVRIDNTYTTVHGGGVFELDRKAETVSLGGESRAYGRVHRKDLKSLAEAVRRDDGWKVVVK